MALELLPAARRNVSTDFFVTRERAATFAPGPGTGRRGPAATALPGLVLAGAWTATGWPATMEGAVRSGERGRTPSSPPADTPLPAHLRSRRRCERASERTPAPPVPQQERRLCPLAGLEAAESRWTSAHALERGRTLAPRLRAASRPPQPPMDTVAAYHFGWIDGTVRPRRRRRQGRPPGAGGALRRGRRADATEVGIPGAVAVELVHNFSLLHDDLMDGDGERRHRDTVWTVYGPARRSWSATPCSRWPTRCCSELGTVEAGRARPPLTTAAGR